MEYSTHVLTFENPIKFKTTFILLFTFSFISLSETLIAGTTWSITKNIDPLTDDNVTIASSSYSSGITKRSAFIRCKGEKFDVYFDFGEFLHNDLVSIKYRFDKQPLVEEKWLPSADGTSVFADHDANLARGIREGNALIIEAEDFRGQTHRSTFDLSGSREALKTVLKQCNISLVSLDKKIGGLRKDFSLMLERWGPKNIFTYKKILTNLGKYKGPLNTSLEPNFALSVQKFYDDYISNCREGTVAGASCSSLQIFWKNDMEPVMPRPSSIIYERATGALAKEAGKLFLGE